MKLEARTHYGIGATYQVRVMQPTNWDSRGRVTSAKPVTDWTAPQRNLILPAGYTSTWQDGTFASILSHNSSGMHAGTGTTPNKVILDGTFSQTGTTVTRVSGVGVFASGNVNDFIKFASGEYAKIVSFTNTLQVEVDRSQAVAAAALTVYDTSRTLLDTWVKGSSTNDGAAGASGATHDTDAGTYRVWRTCNFSTESVARTYTEIGFGTGILNSTVLFSRILLDSPVNVDIGQFLQVRADLMMKLGNYRVYEPLTVNITGWPYTYNVQSIVSNGTYWDVVVDPACSSHYAVGRPITIAGALPVKTNITSLSSTGSDFTVNATAHGKLVGDSIVLEGVTPSGYNGTWTVATVPNANSLTVTSGINPGAGTGGTIRLATPGTWYNGTHTIASFPNSTTIRITNATSIAPAGIGGTVKNNLNATGIITNYAFGPSGNWSGVAEPGTAQSKSLNMWDEANIRTGLVYGSQPSLGTALGSGTVVAGTYDTANRSQVFTGTVASGTANSQTIRQITFGIATSQPTGRFWITFEERQRKDNGYQLVVAYTVSWEPDLL